jgi:deoxyribonuclease V
VVPLAERTREAGSGPPEPAASERGLYAAVDVHYPAAGGARAACVAAREATFARIAAQHAVRVPEVLPYSPGKFYLRELPPLRGVLAELLSDGAERLALIIVDGYVDLDPGGRPGLGARVHAEFGVPVVGVAKTAFATATHAVPVLRGQSERPLFVTAAGISRAEAARLVRDMAGSYRMPDALRQVDALARRI